VDNKDRKLFVITQPWGCKFVPKMYQNTFGGQSGPAGGAYVLPRLPFVAMRGYWDRGLMGPREGNGGRRGSQLIRG